MNTNSIIVITLGVVVFFAMIIGSLAFVNQANKQKLIDCINSGNDPISCRCAVYGCY